jgi:tetratricopeptide (TPR) repeat protein
MKRLASVFLLLILTTWYGFTDDLTGELQWLAVEIACIGQYSNAQAGNYTLGDPRDHYRPADIREYLTVKSGDRTRTQTFYGICFDYAQAAYDEIMNNRNHYESLGMKKNGWYIAVVKDNSRQIILYDPVSQDKATDILNGVYLKEHSRQNVRNHGDTTWHAWLWVYGNDGTIYWIDPTWTDNAGYVVWGVVQNGEEVSRYPDTSLCMVPINPGDPSFAALNRGNASKNKSDWDQAIAEYTEALRINPNNAAAYNNRGNAYYDKGDYDRAIADYNQAIRLDPNFVFAYNNRGNAYDNKGDSDRAIADYNQAIRLDPNFATAYTNRGNMYGEGDYDRAIADHTQAIRLDPNYAPANNNRASAYYNKGDYDRAIADLTQAIRLDPNYAAAYNNRGYMYYYTGDYDRAIADYEAALRIDPNFARARNNLEAARRTRGW